MTVTYSTDYCARELSVSVLDSYKDYDIRFLIAPRAGRISTVGMLPPHIPVTTRDYEIHLCIFP